MYMYTLTNGPSPHHLLTDHLLTPSPPHSITPSLPHTITHHHLHSLSTLQLHVQCGKGLHSYEVMHDTSRITVVRPKVEPPQHRVFNFFVAFSYMLLDGRVLDADRFGEISVGVWITEVQL